MKTKNILTTLLVLSFVITAFAQQGATKLDELSDAKSKGTSVFLGFNAGKIGNFSNNGNTSVGIESLNKTGIKINNISFGLSNTALGYRALFNNVMGNGNTAIGYEAGLNSLGSSNVFLGYKAGSNEHKNGKLYIENSNSSTPLIGGDFKLDEVTINGDLEVVEDLEVDGNYTRRLTSPDSGPADMKAYIYGSVHSNGGTMLVSSTDGFSSGKMADGHYRIMFRGLNKPISISYIVLSTVMENGRRVYVKTYDGYFDVFTIYYRTTRKVDSPFNFVVYKK